MCTLPTPEGRYGCPIAVLLRVCLCLRPTRALCACFSFPVPAPLVGKSDLLPLVKVSIPFIAFLFTLLPCLGDVPYLLIDFTVWVMQSAVELATRLGQKSMTALLTSKRVVVPPSLAPVTPTASVNGPAGSMIAVRCLSLCALCAWKHVACSVVMCCRYLSLNISPFNFSSQIAA